MKLTQAERDAVADAGVRLDEVIGTRDFSHIGESATYPTGYGCELCT